jgi:PAS domain S-box-containing protein
VLKTVEFPKSDTTHNLYVAITVSDTGIGIPADKIESIFESFEQVDGSTNRRYDGTGLGLCLSKQLLELQGGKIFVESTEGSGSRFTFILPIAGAHKVNTPLPNDSETAIALNEAKRSEKTPTPAFKILIVDDDPLNLELFVMYLSSPEYAVTTAKSGPEALAKLEEGFKPDLILLDVIMPRMTGYEVTLKIRETWPANELPVLLISAQSEVSDVVAGLEIGSNDYITKPVNGKELLARITTHLTLKRLDAENSIAALVFKSSHIGIVITDANVNIIKANQAYLDLFGYTIEEILGRNPSIVSSGQHDESFYQSMWDALLTKGYWYGKMVDRRKDGKIWTSWLSISAIKDKHDKVSHYVGFLYD